MLVEVIAAVQSHHRDAAAVMTVGCKEMLSSQLCSLLEVRRKLKY